MDGSPDSHALTHSVEPVRIMAILNMTPDSFSDGGRWNTLDKALAQADMALAQGAEILDIGGESTRPGAATVDTQTELARVLPVVKALRRHCPSAILSVDTRKADVANAALQEGADWVNDVSGLQYDSAMAAVVARHDAGLVLMHSQGTPEVMQRDPQYPEGVISSVIAFFERQTAQALAAGVSRERIILDPGFGFGKTVAHNLTLLAQLSQFQALGYPLLAGLSRKSFLTLGQPNFSPEQREAVTAAAFAMAIQQGARYVRVHDVVNQVPVIRLAEATRRAAACVDSAL